MSNTPLLNLPEISESQIAKYVTHNEALHKIEAWLIRAKDKDLATPPGSPADGDTYIVAASPTGAWVGHTNHLASYIGGTWVFYAPIEGVRLWVNDEDLLYAYNGSAWASIAGAGTTLPVVDTTGIAKGSSDATKIVRLEVDGLTTATTRVLTVQDKDGIIATTTDAQPYDVRWFFTGVPGVSALVLLCKFPRQVIFPASLTNSAGVSTVAATAQTDFDIQKNGSSVGTMRFAASATSATFIMASQTTYAANDVMKVVAPVTPDATLANIAFTLAGTR